MPNANKPAVGSWEHSGTWIFMFVALMAIAIVLPRGFIIVTFIATPIFVVAAIGFAARESWRRRSSDSVSEDQDSDHPF